MTQSHSSSTDLLPLIPDLRRRIRDGGLRATPCRIAVLGLMQNQTSPLCHSDTVEQLADRAFDQSTVYRALNDLADVGLLKRMELGDHVWRFELPEQNGARIGHPHHLCEACGKIACLSEVAISLTEFGRCANTVGTVREVLLKGTCHDCQTLSDAPTKETS